MNKLTCGFFLLLLNGCALLSNFDQNSYTAAKRIKAEALLLVPEAVDPIASHQAEVDAIKVELSSQLAYEQGKGKANTLSYEQWKIIASEDHDLLGGFLKRWAASPQSATFVNEKKQQISDGFDEILKLEGAKPVK